MLFYSAMGSTFNIIPKERWRRTGIFNLTLIFFYGIVLLICLAISLSRGSTLYSTTTVFEGSCQETDRLNLVFHFLLNLISTLTLASSGFFMQILSSPSRQEIDRAHLRLRSLDIGVSSIKNVRFVSPAKSLGWFILSISSIPIHLFFNSSVFKTNYQGSDWRLTIASSGFGAQGVEFFPPGASLANAGVPSPGLDELKSNGSRCSFGSGYEAVCGEPVKLAEYWNKSSPVYHNITNTAIESGSWHNMTPHACREEYGSCKPRKQYRDVVIVVDTGTDNPDGWTRSQVFSDPHNDLGPVWDSHIPRNDINSLWYSTQCVNYLPTSVIAIDGDTLVCGNSCWFTLGMTRLDLLSNATFSGPDWTITAQESYMPSCVSVEQQKLGFNKTFNALNVKYCLAQPSSTYKCQIRLSNLLLFTTIICVLLKAVTCTLAVYFLSYKSLVTLGDTLESFITNPDPTTLGLGTFDIHDSHRLQFGTRATLGPYDSTELSYSVIPRIWHRKARRLVSTLPKSTLSGSYVPIFFFIGIGGYFASQIYLYDGFSFKGSFGESDSPYFISDYVGEYGFLVTLILANIPQFILSYCFLSYSSMFSRLLAEKEFNSYSLTPHKPLRVSYPAGEQNSTYWLQLPYIYSLPLLIISTLLHWFASNAIFIFVSQGGYLVDFYHDTSQNRNNDWGLPQGATAILGLSPPAILAFFITCVAIVLIPVLYGLRKLPGDMVVGACDSLVLSAACHPYQSTTSLHREELSKSNFNDNSGEIEETDEQRSLRELARKKLLWGVTPLPSSLAAMIRTDREALNLSFCDEDEYLHGPVDGEYYA
ncbi:uncharacterized protein F4807DRAFT_117353 [Annulohypoxylon truncatum]|uniref:uncharacterized protein n=1 Tax=Annulohypoxylon truncatum TaxID=327061 RepID=UPI002008BA21|nr:uncharacterized protein F4807DRAFT_117353 [Annulohypoxylon truncatum]KAI1214170.1 hypothetical protein F4807DRAFT_117353 [Annulohypoxylon truncatum]